MTLFLVLVGVALFGGVLLARRRRRSTLAGLNSDKPSFMVEPPTRRVGSRRGERL